jgi:glucose/arabinose dehydrogenase
VVKKFRGRRLLVAVAGLGSILGTVAADGTSVPSTPPAESSFQKVTLNGAPGEPISLVVLPDGRVLHSTRNGRIFLHDPATGFNRVVSTVPVYQHDEEGLQGLAIDADFERNHWLYAYYSPILDTPLDDPATPTVNEGDAPLVGTPAEFARFRGYLQLSRFKFENNALVLGSEQRILQVPVDRGICCHVGGKIDFDAEGNLFLSTGDDTNPFASDGYNPIDERPDQHPAYDAQRSSSNTNDLRGKLLRIRVQADGSYTIPEGNLFPPGTPRTRAEIYAMGLRNPFRFSVDRRRNVVYLADYSPDAVDPSPERGPAGQGKWTIIRKPGNYGWPYCATAELPYRDFDFATGTSGPEFDCAAPVNESPRNTGRRRLPPVTQPEVWYGATASAEFPELGASGVAPMAGPAYRFDRRSSSPNQWPRYFDGVPIFYEWTRDALFTFQLDRRGDFNPTLPNGNRAITRLLPSLVFQNPIDMQFGSDGALYVLEYGDGYFAENPEAQLSRVDFVSGNFTPVPVVTASVAFGMAPLTVQLSSAGTADPDGDELTLAWDFDADGVVDSTDPNPSVTYAEDGAFAPTLRVVDGTGRAATASARIVVGNTPPVLTFVTPAFGDAFSFGQTVQYQVQVTDDTPVECARVSVQYILGHDQHGHPLSTAQGCSGSFPTQLDGGHAGAEALAAVFVAQYTDAPAAGIPALTAQAVVVLQPPLPPEASPPGAPPPGAETAPASAEPAPASAEPAP